MRVVVTATCGTQGDVNPLVDIACALKEQGADVTMITDGYFGERCRALGLRVITIGSTEEYQAILDNAEQRVNHPETLVYIWLSRLKQHFEVRNTQRSLPAINLMEGVGAGRRRVGLC